MAFPKYSGNGNWKKDFFSTKYDIVTLRKFCGWKERVSVRTAPLAFENILAEKIFKVRLFKGPSNIPAFLFSLFAYLAVQVYIQCS